jgi:hypothetical protein
MTRCSFSLSRLVQVTETGQVVYKAEKDACRAFPDPQRDELARGPKRNFQILDPLEFLAEFTQHIPPQAAHSAAGRALDSRAPTEGWSRLVLEQDPRPAAEGGRSRSLRGTADRSLGHSRRVGSGSQPGRPDLGHAHRAGV